MIQPTTSKQNGTNYQNSKISTVNKKKYSTPDDDKKYGLNLWGRIYVTIPLPSRSR